MKRNIALINGIIYSEYDIFRDKALLISGPTIRGIVDISDIPDGYEQADVGGSHICPGLIDLQIYGSGEELFSAELTVDSLHKIECHLLEQGCTSFYLTLATIVFCGRLIVWILQLSPDYISLMELSFYVLISSSFSVKIASNILESRTKYLSVALGRSL